MEQGAKRRPAAAWGLVLAAVALVVACRGAAAGSLPHILLVSIDTLRPMNLSSYGYDRATSPHIDRLLETGARFTEARTVEPLTAPALATMLTTLPPHEHGSTRNGLRVRANLPSFTKILGRRGYRTAAFVANWTLQDRVSGLAEHFDTYESVLTRKRWFGLARREATADDVVEEALAWLGGQLDREPDRPVLLWVHTVEPHAPYRLQREFLEQIGVKAGRTVFSARRRYDSEIAYADDRTGRLLAGFHERLAEERTVTVFLSDHGESLGEHGYWGHGRHLYDVSLRIPLGFVWPGRISPAVIEEPALITDVGPTLLSLVGLPVPDYFQGFDWSAVLTGGAAPPDGRVTWHQAHRASVQPQEDGARVRQRGLLEVGRIADGRKEILRVPKGRRTVYDLTEDAAEKKSLVPPFSHVSPELRAWLQSVEEALALADDLPPPSLTDEDLQALRALGYID